MKKHYTFIAITWIVGLPCCIATALTFIVPTFPSFVQWFQVIYNLVLPPVCTICSALAMLIAFYLDRRSSVVTLNAVQRKTNGKLVNPVSTKCRKFRVNK